MVYLFTSQRNTFPLNELLRFIVTYNQDEFLEFVCTQELIHTDKWIRDYWLVNIFDIIVWCCRLMKLSTLNVIASYMIPERITKDDFKNVISQVFAHNQGQFNTERQKKRYKDLCSGMVDQGMNQRAQRIVTTRNTLIDCMDDDFPKELIGVVVGFAFGLYFSR